MNVLYWTTEAIQDRHDIYDYIEADNPSAALELDELFAEKASRLLEHPGLGRPGRVSGTRELVTRRVGQRSMRSGPTTCDDRPEASAAA